MVSKHFYVKKVIVLITKCVCVNLEQLFSTRKVLFKKWYFYVKKIVFLILIILLTLMCGCKFRAVI